MKNCCIPIVIFLCTLFIFLNTRTASGQQYPYQHFTVQDGLIQQQVTALHKDSRGYLWVGTKFGLSAGSKIKSDKLVYLPPFQDQPPSCFTFIID